jgi:hypothetical protein
VTDDEERLAWMIVEARRVGDSAHKSARDQGMAWAVWAEQLDRLIRAMPDRTGGPTMLTEDGELDPAPMGCEHLNAPALQARLYRVLADADAIAMALHRAGVWCKKRADELVVTFSPASNSESSVSAPVLPSGAGTDPTVSCVEGS